MDQRPSSLGDGVTEFEDFVARHRTALRRALVARYGVDVGLDAVSAAMEYAWREWPRVSAMANPAGYLYRVGQTEARRHGRWSHPPDLPAESQRPPDATDLGAALAELPRDHRVAVVLVHSHGYSYEEASELMEIPVTTLRNYVARGMKRLRNEMGTEDGR